MTISLHDRKANPVYSWTHAMIAQSAGATRDFLKASRICDYGQRKKIACGINKQARGRGIRGFSGLSTLVLAIFLSSMAHAGPVLWVADSLKQLGTVDVQTGNVTLVGETSVAMSDIAFDPLGVLYGAGLDGNLYTINPATASTSLVGNIGAFVNSLVFDASGTLYAASNVLHTLDLATGLANLVGNGGTTYNSSGDLAFIGGRLYLSSTNPNSVNDDLFVIDVNNGSGSLVGSIGFSEVLGLATDNNIDLFGLSGTSVLAIDPATGVGSELLDYSGQGLGQAYGSAFTNEAAVVPVVPTAFVFCSGLIALSLVRSGRSQ
ncbi:MAG TPA: hypothetical protein ENJ21_01635 [Chromatiaceae bacterium]|nr:hypothetical protein [Chromatiaceae bacterium]